MADSAVVQLQGEMDDLTSTIDDALGAFENLGEDISFTLEKAMDGVGDKIVAALAGGLQQATPEVAEAADDLGDVITQGVAGPLAPLVAIFDKIVDWSSSAWERVQDGVSSLANYVGEAWESMKSGISGTLGSIGGVISSTFGAIKDKVSGIFSGMLDGLMGAVRTALQQVPLLMVDISTGLSEGFRGLAEQDRNMTRVAAAVTATGGAAGRTAEELNDMANAMQQVTTYGDDVVLGAQAILLQFKNIRGDVFDDALAAAADFAAATGTDLASAADKLGRVLNNPTMGLRQLSAEGVYFTKVEQDMIKQMVYAGQVTEAQRIVLDRMAGTFKGAAAAAAQSFTGRMQQLANVVGDAWEAIADALTPALGALIPYMESGAKRLVGFASGLKNLTTQAVEWVKEAWPTIQSFLDNIMEGVQVAMKWVVDRSIEAVTLIQTAWQDLDGTWDAIVAQAMAAFQELKVTMLDVWKSVTDSIGSLFDAVWIRVKEGFFTMLRPVAEAIDELTGTSAATKVLNAAQKTSRTADAVFAKERLKGKQQDEDPFAAERERLAELQAMAAQAGGAFGARFEENLEKNRGAVDGWIDSVRRTLGLEVGGGGGGGPGGNAPFIFEREDAQGTSGNFEDLLSLNRRIASAAAKSPEERAIDNQVTVMKGHHNQLMKLQEKQVKLTEEQKEETKKVVAAIEQGVPATYA